MPFRVDALRDQAEQMRAALSRIEDQIRRLEEQSTD
jgi:hypothetical protein